MVTVRSLAAGSEETSKATTISSWWSVLYSTGVGPPGVMVACAKSVPKGIVIVALPMQIQVPARLRHTSTCVLPVVGSATLRTILKVEMHKFVGTHQAQSMTPAPPFAGGVVRGAEPVVV